MAALGAASVILGCGGAGAQLLAIAVQTLAGAGLSGLTDGNTNVAQFNNPVNAIFGPDGAIYVADFDNNRIRRIRGDIVSTIFSNVNFQRPFGLAFVGNTLYVQTDGNDQGERNANTGTIWQVNITNGSGSVLARNLGRPRGLAAMPDGRLMMSNLTRNTIQIFDPANPTNVQTIAGSDGAAGDANGTGAVARFNRPYGLARLSDGSFLVADQSNHKIKRVTLAGEVTTYAGSTAGFADSNVAASAKFDSPQDVAIGPGDVVYVADNMNHRFRRIGVDGVTTVAGNGTPGFADGERLQSSFFGMEGFDVSGDGNTLVIADGNGGDDTRPFNRVRLVGLQ